MGKAVFIIGVTVSEPGRTGTMALETSRLHPLFGVEIMGLDVRRVDEATVHDADIAWRRAKLAALRETADPDRPTSGRRA